MYDGIRNALGLTGEQLGTASNIVNIILLVVVFLQEGIMLILGYLFILFHMV